MAAPPGGFPLAQKDSRLLEDLEAPNGGRGGGGELLQDPGEARRPVIVQEEDGSEGVLASLEEGETESVPHLAIGGEVPPFDSRLPARGAEPDGE